MGFLAKWQVRASRDADDASFGGALVIIWGLGRRASCSCPARQGRTGHRSWKELAAPVDRACHKSWLDPSGNLGLEKQTATEPSGTRVTFDFNFALALLKNSSEKIVRSMKDAFKGMQTCSSPGPLQLPNDLCEALASPTSPLSGPLQLPNPTFLGVSLDSGSDWPVRP